MFDKMLNKLVSRKLVVWVVATIAMFSGPVNADQWIIVSSIYLGLQGVQDTLAAKTIKTLVDKVD